jgi:hypothetical protein
VLVHLPLDQLLQLTTPPAQVMQHRCWVPAEFCWQYLSVQACPRADGSNSSSAALVSRPNDVRIGFHPSAR